VISRFVSYYLPICYNDRNLFQWGRYYKIVKIMTFIIGLILGALSSWGITHWYYKKSTKDQTHALQSLSKELKESDTLKYFELLLETSVWKKEFIDDNEIWISETNNTFQIHTGDHSEDFHEPWTKVYPAQDTVRCPVYLKINGTTIKQLSFIVLDGGRIFVPMPDRSFNINNNPEFFWNLKSLELKVCKIIGRYYIYKNIQGIADTSKINIID